MVQESAALSLTVERKGDIVQVSLRGRIGEMEAGQLQRDLVNLVEQGALKLVVDLSDVPYLTSTGLGALMVAHKRVRPNGGYVRVAGPNPLVRQILEITKLTKLFGGYATVEEAMRAE
jgi:anti-anti-sigma factor